MLDRKRIVEVLDSCRPESDDLSAPELADVAGRLAADPELDDLREQIETLDLKIAAAYHDVPIPPGLEERLTAAIVQAQPLSHHRPARLRRRLVIFSGTVAAVGLMLLVMLFNWDRTPAISEQTALDEAIRYFDAETAAVPAGRLLSESSPPNGIPFSKSLLSLRGIRWRAVANLLGQSGIAFDLPAPAGNRATLYALRQTVSGLGDTPTERPFATGGRCAAAWRENGVTYVLVVQGAPNSLENYLNLPRGPLA